MAIFNSYVKLPGGISLKHGGNAEARPRPSPWHTNRGTVAPQSQRACHCGPCQTLDRRRDIAPGDAMGFTLKTSLGTQSLGFSTFPWVTFGYWWIYIYILYYIIYMVYIELYIDEYLFYLVSIDTILDKLSQIESMLTQIWVLGYYRCHKSLVFMWQ